MNEEEKNKNQDALEKLEGVKNFNQSSPSPERVQKTNQEDDETLEPLNIELSKDDETISLEGDLRIDGKKPFGIDLGQTLDRNNQDKVKAVLESANADYNSLLKNNVIGGKQPSSAILVSDDGEIPDYLDRNGNGEESSTSDLHDISKSSESKKDIFTKVQSKFDKIKESKEETKEDPSDINLNSETKKSNHSRSFEDLADVDNIEELANPISNIDIERIGSPNKPKQTFMENSERLKDDRQKLDDEEEDEEIITGSHIINNFHQDDPDTTTMIDLYKKLDSVQKFDTTNDLGLVINDLCENLIKGLDKTLFPQRPIFFLTTDMSNISLEQAATLLREITPAKEELLVQKIIEQQNKDNPPEKTKKPKRKSKGSKDKGKSNNKIVLYEKKGIRTDLVAVEHYVDALHKHIDKNRKMRFLTNLFTSMKHDPFEQLNQLQNSDIGSCDHFQIDMNKQATLNLDSYLEMENYWKKKEKEEDMIMSDPKEEIKACTSKSKRKKSKRKRFEFDHKGLNKEQIEGKKKVFRECQHIHNKALFDCVNEALVQFRPYAKGGEPPAWSSKNRTLKQSPKNHKYGTKQIFEKVRNDMFSW